jgi:hypothetical protein
MNLLLMKYKERITNTRSIDFGGAVSVRRSRTAAELMSRWWARLRVNHRREREAICRSI